MKTGFRSQDSGFRIHPRVTAWWLGVLAACLSAFAAQAQNFTVDWSTISGGGDASAGGAYAISGTIAQAGANSASGGNYVVEAGFWSVIEVLQTPGLPVLGAVLSGSSMTISWDSQATGFVLEQTTSLIAPVNWTTVSGVTGNRASITASPGNKFFRLHHP